MEKWSVWLKSLCSFSSNLLFQCALKIFKKTFPEKYFLDFARVDLTFRNLKEIKFLLSFDAFVHYDDFTWKLFEVYGCFVVISFGSEFVFSEGVRPVKIQRVIELAILVALRSHRSLCSRSLFFLEIRSLRCWPSCKAGWIRVRSKISLGSAVLMRFNDMDGGERLATTYCISMMI